MAKSLMVFASSVSVSSSLLPSSAAPFWIWRRISARLCLGTRPSRTEGKRSSTGSASKKKRKKGLCRKLMNPFKRAKKAMVSLASW